MKISRSNLVSARRSTVLILPFSKESQDKHSSLFSPFIRYEEKKFCDYGHSVDCLDMRSKLGLICLGLGIGLVCTNFCVET
jgi:hypothetical protein